MIVKLKDVHPNPYRDIKSHPIDEERVQDLMQSISSFDFWGGMPGRITEDGVIQLAAGHHRLEAAKRSGIKEADLPIRKGIPDSEMVRMLCVENATQEGLASSQAGSVAAAIRLAAKSLATGKPEEMFAHSKGKKVSSNEGTFSNMELSQWVNEFENGAGIGERLVTKILSSVPGVDKNVIEDQIGFLKAAGHYQRIINEVQVAIQQDRQRAIEEAEAAEQAERDAEAANEAAEQKAKAKQKKEAAKKKAEAAAESEKRVDRASEKATKPITVHPDIQGILKEATLVAQFRKSVTQPETAKYFPVEKQPALARMLVDWAKKVSPGKRLTALFIRERIVAAARDGRGKEKRADKADREERERKSMVARYLRYIKEFSIAWVRVAHAAAELDHLEKEWPADLPKPYDQSYIDSISFAHRLLGRLYAKISKTTLLERSDSE